MCLQSVLKYVHVTIWCVQRYNINAYVYSHARANTK